MRSLSFAFVGLLGVTSAAAASFSSANVKDMFDSCMEYLDEKYDSDFHYMYNLETENAMRHTTVESPWYALGLLMRNQGNDVDEAEKIIGKVIDGQFTDKSKQWYGSYTRSPSQPVVGSRVYPAKIYGSWDPNYRGFIGTTLAMMLEEHSDVLSDAIQERMLESLHRAVIGDTYRVGGVDGDNLYPGYSNPAIMRAFTAGWLGRRIKDHNLTKAGETDAREIIELFDITNTLSEFGSPTYFGISLFGLVLWHKYLPADSVMAQAAPRMVRKTWQSIAQRWHPDMKNLAGPWDRTYGFDMNRYFSLLGLWLWAYIGQEKSSITPHVPAVSHSKDHAWGPVIATLAETQESLLPKGFFNNFVKWKGDRIVKSQVYYPPYDLEVRNVTTWMSKDLTIGAQSFRQRQKGGPTTTSYTPAAVQWITGNDVDEVAFMILRPTEAHLKADVSANRLSLTYPSGTANSVFNIAVGTFLSKPMINGIHGLPGLNVTISGNTNPKPTLLSFGGRRGGSASPVTTFEVWNFQFTMPEVYFGSPKLVLTLNVK